MKAKKKPKVTSPDVFYAFLKGGRTLGKVVRKLKDGVITIHITAELSCQAIPSFLCLSILGIVGEYDGIVPRKVKY